MPDMDMDMDMDKPEEAMEEPTIEGEDEAVEETEETEVEESKKTVEEHLREYSEMVKASTGGDDDKSAKYRDDCLKNGKEIDYTKINGLSHETLFSHFYEKTKLCKKNLTLRDNSQPRR